MNQPLSLALDLHPEFDAHGPSRGTIRWPDKGTILMGHELENEARNVFHPPLVVSPASNLPL
jgi:hypothetical protein